MYYYLKPEDIVQAGDELSGYENTYWVSVNSTVGERVNNIRGVPNLKVRRQLRITKLGNEL